MTTDFAHQFGGASNADYNAASTAFAKAVKLMKEHNLVNEFKNRCEELFEFDNLYF